MNPQSMIACCLICTLAENKKDCPICPFNAGLYFQAWQAVMQMFDKEKMK